MKSLKQTINEALTPGSIHLTKPSTIDSQTGAYVKDDSVNIKDSVTYIVQTNTGKFVALMTGGRVDQIFDMTRGNSFLDETSGKQLFHGLVEEILFGETALKKLLKYGKNIPVYLIA